MIFDALQEIAGELRVEKLHGELHQLDKEVREERDVDAGTDVQEDFPADEVDGRATEQQYHLCDERQPDERDVFAAYPCVYERLREEREDELQQAADEEAEDELRKEAFVSGEVFPEETHTIFCGFQVSFLFIKETGGFEQQHNALLFPSRPRADPMLAKFFTRIGDKAFSGVGDGYFAGFSSFADGIDHDEMVLIPMRNARERDFFDEVVKRKPSAHAPQSDFFCRLTDTQ